MQWREVGPFRGGRALAIAGVPSEPNTYFFGAVAGGIWKTTDGGANWHPVFDSQHGTSSIGALAVAPSDPNIIYAGTGEAAPRGNITYGDGVYKSVDGGKTWQNVGLKDSRHIGAIIVNPEIRTSSSSPRSATPSGLTTSAASSARPTAARPGRKS